MADKDFKTVEQQLKILRSRSLTITNDAKAKSFLLHNNSYRVRGYSLTLRKMMSFSKSTTFQNIIDIYQFDHGLRHIILKYMEITEVRMKPVYAYKFTRVHGPVATLMTPTSQTQ